MKRAQAIEHPMRHSKRKRYSCQQCADVDDDDMVMCEICYKWSHYRCAGVGPEIEDLYFACENCKDIDKYINSTDTYVKAKATEKTIRNARKLAGNSQKDLAERDLPELDRVQLEDVQEISVEQAQSQLDTQKITQEINSLTFVHHERTDQLEVIQNDTEFIDFVEADIGQLCTQQQSDYDKETESVELAQAIFVQPELVPEPEPELEDQLTYKLPIKKKRHIKRFNSILRSQEIFSAQALEHSEYFTLDYKEMVRAVSQSILADEFLKKYSYCGARDKKQFKKYSKVIELIVEATAIKFPEVQRSAILNYFKNDYIKYAKRRDERKNQ